MKHVTNTGQIVREVAPQPQQAAPVAVPAGNWEGAEEWMPLAWELCANECGEEACTELVWEGGPIPEPWGDRWLKYEDQAKEMIALVRKLVPSLAASPQAAPTPPQGAPAPQPVALTDEQRIDWLCEEAEFTCGQWQVVIDSDKESFLDAVDEMVRAAHGITQPSQQERT